LERVRQEPYNRPAKDKVTLSFAGLIYWVKAAASGGFLNQPVAVATR